MSPTQHHRTVTLADAIDEYPQLKQCRNEDAARRKLRSLRNNPLNSNQESPVADAFENEEQLQKYLEQHWDATILGTDWKLYGKGHVDTHEIGIIDLLAEHRNRPSWLVVELKVRKTSDEVLGQVLRYMGWVKQHRAAKNHAVEGLVIASTTDPQTWYGLKCLPNVRMMCYQFREDALKLSEARSPDFEKAANSIEKLSPEQCRELLAELQALQQQQSAGRHGSE